MNKIVTDIIEARHGHYCHALEVNEPSQLEATVEALIDELGDKYTKAEYIEFFRSASLYYLGDDPETERAVYDFDFNQCIEDCIY